MLDVILGVPGCHERHSGGNVQSFRGVLGPASSDPSAMVKHPARLPFRLAGYPCAG
jgi:hypothetical protein